MFCFNLWNEKLHDEYSDVSVNVITKSLKCNLLTTIQKCLLTYFPITINLQSTDYFPVYIPEIKKKYY